MNIIEPVEFDTTSVKFQEYSLTPGDVAHWFFGKSSHWIRWLDRDSDRKKGTARTYSLLDVQELAIKLLKEERIPHALYTRAIQMVRLQAEISGMFENPFELDGVSYPLKSSDIASMASRTSTWVRAHAEDLGGVKRQWDEDSVQVYWRFPEDGMDEKIQTIIHGETPSP